jgi:hypothetical protein
MITEEIGSDAVITSVTLRAKVSSYDTGYEHSLEHLIDVQKIVDEADAEPHAPAWLHALGIEF